MDKQTPVTLSLDAIEQRLKGVLASAFSDGTVTENSAIKLLHRIMCSLKGEDPESLTFEELTSYMPAPECAFPDRTPPPGSIKALIDAADAARRLLVLAQVIQYPSGFASAAYIEQYSVKLDAALAPFKGTQEDAGSMPHKPTITIPRNVQRHEDMSPEGVLRLFLQEDGDVIVEVSGREEHGEREKASAEFCSGGGGGLSPRTLEALKVLMAAMQADNDAGHGSRDYERKYYFDMRPEDQDWSR